MSANNTFLRLSLASVLIGSMLGMPAVVCASSPAQTTSEVQQNTNVSSEIVKLWVQRNKQRRELAGIKDQLNKTQAGLDELKQLINEVRLKNPDDDRAISEALAAINDLGKLFKSTLNNRLHRNLACVIDKSSRGAKLERAFEELPLRNKFKRFLKHPTVM